MEAALSSIYRVRVHRDGRFWFTKYFATKQDAEEYMSQNKKFGDEYPCGALKVSLHARPRDMVYELERVGLEESAIMVEQLNVQWGKREDNG